MDGDIILVDLIKYFNHSVQTVREGQLAIYRRGVKFNLDPYLCRNFVL